MGGTHGRGRRKGKRGDAGASLVEFALILPVFAMLIFGMITAGLALNDKQEMTHATREGARFAATVPADQVFTSGTWASNVQDLIVERSADTLTASDICVSLVEGSPGSVVDNNSDYSTNGTTPCIAGQTYPTDVDNGRRVQVTASKPATIDLIVFGAYHVTMDVEATALSEPSA